MLQDILFECSEGFSFFNQVINIKTNILIGY